MVVVACIAVARGSVNHGKLELILVGAELDKEVENLVDNLLGTRAGSVDLIEDNKRLFAESESLLKHEACLGHTTLKRVYEENNAVHHLENALYLAAEVGVSGSVHDIDFDVVIHYCRGL